MSLKLNKSLMAIVVAAFAAFIATFNETFLNIAFTPIMQDFGIAVSTVQWLATAYMLGAAIMIPVSAFAYRRIPTRLLFKLTVAILVIGSIVTALSTNFAMLLIGRIIQSLATGLLIPIGMNIVLEVAPKQKLGSYMGIMGAMTTLGPSISVIAAGSLLAISGWHTLLWVFTALTAILFICSFNLPKDIAKLAKPRLDTLSVILIGLALVGILYGISTIFSGNIVIAIISIIVGAILMGIFVYRQNKLDEPLINLKPLTTVAFSIGVIINMLSLIIIFAMNIVMPIFLQGAKSTSSLGASLALFPAILLSCVLSPIAGKIYDKHGIKVILPLGFALMCIFAIALSILKDVNSLLLIAILYIPIICGSALIIGPIQSFALSRLKPELNPHGVTIMSTGFQIAGCIGSSIFTGVYSLVLGIRTTAGVSAYEAASSGFFTAGILAAAFAFIGLVLALYIRKYDKQEAKTPVKSSILRTIMKEDVFTIDSTATLLDTMKLITDKKISGVPVVDGNKKLVGFISDGDIVKYLSKSHPLFVSAYSFAAINSESQSVDTKLNELMHLKVTDIARKNVITVNVTDDFDEVCRVLDENHLKKVPVMENGKMIGIINRSNITKYAMNSCLEAMNA